MAGNLYLTWAQASAAVTTNNGCGCDNRMPVAVEYAYSKDEGKTWSRPITVGPAGRNVPGSPLWPWAAAGSDGRVALAWFQSDQLTRVDIHRSSISVYAASITSADTPNPRIDVVDASGGPVHYGTVCQGGVDCVVNGKDRRLGDYLTDFIDLTGRLWIAYADTSHFPGSIVSRPALIHQVSGPSFLAG